MSKGKKKKKGVGFGPRPLTQLARPMPRQPTFDEMVPPIKKEEGLTPGEKAVKAAKGGEPLAVEKELTDSEREQQAVDKLAREIGPCYPDGRPMLKAIVAAAQQIQAQDSEPPEELVRGAESEGVAPQPHAPDEVLAEPWSEETPGVPLPTENGAGDAAHLTAPASDAEEDVGDTLESLLPAVRPQVRLRLQTQMAAPELEKLKGKVLREQHYNVLLSGPTVVRKPSGSLLCIYLPGVLEQEMQDLYPLLSTIRLLSDNRGLASGSVRVKAGTSRTRTKPVMSGVMGSMDPVGPMQYCRLTAFTAKNVEKWDKLLPLWQAIATQFETHVPDRFKTQVEYARRTPPEWVIKGTPFTTITINNSYSTGVHTDSGDLDAGFSTLAVARRGPYTGGVLTFPQFQVGADMQDGDLILMDAHEWHGNTLMHCACDGGTRELSSGPCKDCGAERISVVAYYRTKMEGCGDFDSEQAKKAAYGARRLDARDENAADLAAVSTKA